jgi:geranylgeranyl reductase family protein
MAGEGLGVLALERAPDRRKACGGCVTEKAAHYLPRMWRDAGAYPVYSAQLTSGDISVEARMGRPVASLVDRLRFDAFLRQHAKDRGATVLWEAVREVREESGSVSVRTSRGRHRARYVVGAGGANCPCARWVNRVHPAARVMGMAAEMELPRSFRPGGIRLVMGLSGYGYGWLFPREDRLNVGLTEYVSKARRLKPAFQRLLAGEAAEETMAWVRSRPIPCHNGRRRLSRGRVVLTGDAAGLVDPLSGEGIAYAAASGIRAGRAIINGLKRRGRDTFPGYRLWVREKIYPEFRWAALLAEVAFRIPRRFTGLMAARPELFEYYMELLGGRGSYRVFVREMAKAVGGVAARQLCRAVP